MELAMQKIRTNVWALALTALWLVAVSCSSRDSHVAENWVAGWNSHDVEKIIPVFTGDALYEDVAFSEVNHGSGELRKFAAAFLEAVPDLRMELINSSLENGHGTIEWRLSGTDKGIYKTGKKFSVRGASIIDVRGGKISRNLDFYDSAEIMRQVGLLPSAAAK
jgi:steroid delta-isomerase-like uncharacterized protein